MEIEIDANRLISKYQQRIAQLEAELIQWQTIAEQLHEQADQKDGEGK